MKNFGALLTWFPALFALMGMLLAYVFFVGVRRLGSGSANDALDVRFPLIVLLVGRRVNVARPGCGGKASRSALHGSGLAIGLYEVTGIRSGNSG